MKPDLFTLLHVLSDAVRIGHATNSSSSHSIVLCRRDASQDAPSIAPRDHEYGWGWFRLSKAEEKADYLSVMLADQVADGARVMHPLDYDDPLANEARDLPGRIGRRYSELTFRRPCPDGSVDHQSAFSFPLDRPHRPDMAFARWFADQVADPRVAILGGNDNEEAPSGFSPANALAFAAQLPHDEYRSPMSVLDRGTHWLLFRPEDGRRLRIAKQLGQTIKTSTHPELVDIKVTDWCDIGCSYCYQDSTRAGGHADDRYVVLRLADLVTRLGVREVAIGGGEPTGWPHLDDFVASVAQKGVTPNLTTRRPDKISRATLGKLGSVGVSVDTAAKAKAWTKRLDVDNDDVWSRRGKLTFHVVLGAVPMSEVLDICKVALANGSHVLLLGYKQVGRGSVGATESYEDWTRQIADEFMTDTPYGRRWAGPTIGVDTVLVESHRERIERDLGTELRLMTDREGAFSMYIDAVSMSYGRHSYGAPLMPLPVFGPTDSWLHWSEHAGDEALRGFRAWNSEP
jgi:hypothetical protein